VRQQQQHSPFGIHFAQLPNTVRYAAISGLEEELLRRLFVFQVGRNIL
jgi:hypothetical protein